MSVHPDIERFLAQSYIESCISIGVSRSIDLSYWVCTYVEGSRKRKQIMEQLLTKGYVCRVDKNGEMLVWHTTSKAFDELAAVPPTFDGILSTDVGEYFCRLPITQQKFILLNQGNFLFRIVQDGSSAHISRLPSSYSQDRLIVSTAKVDARLAQQRLQKRIQKEICGTISVGLQEILGLPEEDAKTFEKIHVDRKIPYNVKLSDKVDAWKEELEVAIAKTEARIQGDKQYIRLIQRIEQKVDNFGGWPAFHKAYREKVRARTLVSNGITKFVDTSQIPWTYNPEQRCVLSRTYDIVKAKEVLAFSAPRQVSIINVYGLSLDGEKQVSLEDLLRWVDVDPEKMTLDDTIDTSIPVITIPFRKSPSEVFRLVIDGWKRISKLIKSNDSFIASVDLTEEEASRILV